MTFSKEFNYATQLSQADKLQPVYTIKCNYLIIFGVMYFVVCLWACFISTDVERGIVRSEDVNWKTFGGRRSTWWSIPSSDRYKTQSADTDLRLLSNRNSLNVRSWRQNSCNIFHCLLFYFRLSSWFLKIFLLYHYWTVSHSNRIRPTYQTWEWKE